MSDSQNNNKSQNGILILIFGILSLVLFAPLGIVAWVMGQKERKLYPNDSLVTAGWILGIIGTSFLILGVFVILILILLFGTIFAGVFKEIIQSVI